MATRVLAGELGEDRRKLLKVLARGCSSSSSDVSTVLRLRRFAGGAINATVALVLTDARSGADLGVDRNQLQCGVDRLAVTEGYVVDCSSWLQYHHHAGMNNDGRKSIITTYLTMASSLVGEAALLSIGTHSEHTVHAYSSRCATTL